MLELSDVTTYYDSIKILKSVNIKINTGEIVCLLGRNASGKTTVMKTILGIVRPTQGTIEFNGARIDGFKTYKIVKIGISPVPEARRIFGRMSVFENLLIGAFNRNDRKEIGEDLRHIYDLFPILSERKNQPAGTLSGGEQQMLAMGRALMARPKLMLMDEPSLGLSPTFVEKVFELIKEINNHGVTIFVIEQNANMALSVANRGYVLQAGEIILEGNAQKLANNDLVREVCLGEMI